MKNDDKDYLNVLKTSDFTLASTLYYLGYNIIGIDKRSPRRVIFYYKKTSEIEVTVDKYFKKQIKIDPLGFDQAQREIRAQIHTDR